MSKENITFRIDSDRKAALDVIAEIAKSSPFKDLANLASVRAALDDPDHEWKF